eukprot:gene5288-7060_t
MADMVLLRHKNNAKYCNRKRFVNENTVKEIEIESPSPTADSFYCIVIIFAPAGSKHTRTITVPISGSRRDGPAHPSAKSGSAVSKSSATAGHGVVIDPNGFSHVDTVDAVVVDTDVVDTDVVDTVDAVVVDTVDADVVGMIL